MPITLEVSNKSTHEVLTAAEVESLVGEQVAAAVSGLPGPSGLIAEMSRVALNRTQLWWKKNSQYCWSCFHELRFDLVLPIPARVKVWGNVNLTHRANVAGPVGYSIKATVRSAEAFDQMPVIPASSVDLQYWQSVESGGVIPGSKDGGNIFGVEDHYGHPKYNYKLDLPAGCHRIEHWGNSHTTAGSEDNAYAELNQNDVPDPEDPYTMLFLEAWSRA
jgi:hypothetical protein